MTKNDHFETQKRHFWAFLASFKISFSSLQHPSHRPWNIFASFPNTPMLVAVETSLLGNHTAAKRGGTWRSKGIVIPDIPWPMKVNHAKVGSSEKHFMIAPAVFNPDPISTIVLKFVYSSNKDPGIWYRAQKYKLIYLVARLVRILVKSKLNWI